MEDEDDSDSDFKTITDAVIASGLAGVESSQVMDFACKKCGFCCQLDVVLYPEDVVRIKALGETGFFKERSGETVLKHKNGYCIFFNLETRRCGIYENRPDVCKRFPFRDELKGNMSHKCRQRKDFTSKVAQNLIMFMNEKEMKK